VFDNDGGPQSIGDLAIAPSDPNIIWGGTGEPNNRVTLYFMPQLESIEFFN
jgi:hypothetical protein